MNWTRLTDEELLERRISRLGLTLAGTEVEPWIREFYRELADRDLVFNPPCFVADEWFVPEGIPAIGIPFYLAHPRLKKLEQKIILETEGGTRRAFMRLIRHEAGHAYAYAYGLTRRPKWRRLFGPSSREDTPTTYRPRPYSRSFVIHLDNWYAQSHPDEDFAETFAVWLTPRHNWRERYRGWGALKKLEYVDELMRSVAGRPPARLPRFRASKENGLGVRLRTYFARKRKLYEESYPEFYDNDLKRLFTDVPAEASGEKASRFLRSARRSLIRTVALWTRERHYTVDQLLGRLIERCDELGLRVRKADPELRLNLTVFITSLVTAYLFTGKFKRSK